LIIISACLLGVKCRYDGKVLKRNCFTRNAIGQIGLRQLIPVCPEQLGGLSTPRPKVKIKKGGKAINEQGEDVTRNFRAGASEVLKIAKLFGIKKAILKSNSPSCGKDGITAKRLKKAGIKITWID
jgi:uncharacterized protein YbbK (DUF523 family)